MTRYPPAPLRWLRRTRRGVLAHRRLLAALCAAVAVAAGLQANAAPPARRTMVLTAAHDLTAGQRVAPGDLRRTPYAPGSVPEGTVPDAAAALGRTMAGPVRSGEPITDARLVTGSLLAGYPGLVAIPVRIGDPGAVRLLRVGDRVTLLAADPQGGSSARLLGHDVPVLAIPAADDRSSPSQVTGALVVLGLAEPAALEVAQASVSGLLSVAVTR